MTRFRIALLGLLAVCLSAQAADTFITPDHLNLAYLLRPLRDVRGRSSLCGMHIMASMDSKAEPTLQWDFMINVITDGSSPTGGISAGSFEIPRGARRGRTPRHEISELRLSTKEDVEPLVVPISRHANPVLGALPAAYAKQLFEALYRGTPVSILISYVDDKPENLLIKSFSNSGRFNQTRDQLMEECLEGLVPAKDPSAPYMEINAGNGH